MLVLAEHEDLGRALAALLVIGMVAFCWCGLCLYWTVRRHLERRRMMLHRCRRCGYSLYGLPPEVVTCPECGGPRSFGGIASDATFVSDIRSAAAASVIGVLILALILGIILVSARSF